MLYSYNWLKDYVPGLPKPEKMADALTMHAFEVEEVKKMKDDYCLDISVLANRAPDCFSHIGMAREIAAILNLKFKIRNSKLKEDKETKTKNFISVSVESKNDCPRYMARVVKNVKIGPSPKWIQERLEVCGLRPINNLVDATNFIMLETGQPLHVFDADKLSGGISVRRGKAGEKIFTLDGDRYDLNENILVIADSQEPLAIAGIKGGKKAEIGQNTKNIVIEAANFDSALIRKTSQKLRLRTDASLRFEHKIDAAAAEFAINRTAQIINELAGGQICSGLIDIYQIKSKKKIIKLSLDYAQGLLGMKVLAKDIKDIFKRLELKILKADAVSIEVEIPSFRLDLVLQEDLIEEIGRILGYEKMPGVFPIGYLAPPKRNLDVYWEDFSKNILRDLIFNESYNYSFISEKDVANFGLKAEDLMELENPISSDFKYLRPSLLIGLIKNAVLNFKFGEELRMFEMGNIFANKKETKIISGVVAGKKNSSQFYILKGVIDSLLNKMGIADVAYEGGSFNFLNKNKSAKIKVGQEEIGFLGEISPEILKKFKLDAEAVAFDLNFEKISALCNEETAYRPISQYPAAIRDVAILVPLNIKVEDVLNKINGAGGALVSEVELFDIYEGEGLPEGKKNLAFHIIYQSKDKTLSNEEITGLHSKIIKALEDDPEWEVRK